MDSMRTAVVRVYARYHCMGWQNSAGHGPRMKRMDGQNVLSVRSSLARCFRDYRDMRKVIVVRIRVLLHLIFGLLLHPTPCLPDLQTRKPREAMLPS
jgi:hypothetical protein